MSTTPARTHADKVDRGAVRDLDQCKVGASQIAIAGKK